MPTRRPHLLGIHIHTQPILEVGGLHTAPRRAHTPVRRRPPPRPPQVRDSSQSRTHERVRILAFYLI